MSKEIKIQNTAHGNKGNLVDGSILAHLIRLTVPMTWGIAAIISFQLVDTFFISKLGTSYLAAISFTFPVTYLIFSFTIGFGIAMSSVASRLIGEGKMEDVQRVATHGLIMVFVVACIIALIGILLHDTIFRAMGANPDMILMIRDYMLIWFGGNIFITLPLVGNAAIRATGDTLAPALIMGVVALVNVVLDPILIYGWFGIPAMGLKGAAIATVFGNGCAVIASLYVLGAKKNLLLPLNDMHFHLFRDSMKRLLIIALPAGLTNSITPLVGSIIVAVLAVYGPEVVAAYGVASRIEAFAFIILMALSVGMAPIIGQNWGAGKIERSILTVKLAVIINVIWSLIIAVLLMIFAKNIAMIFSDDPAVIDYAITFFWIVPLSYICANPVNAWVSTFNAIGKPRRSFMIIFIKMIILTLPAIYIGSALYGATGIFMAIAGVNYLSGLLIHAWSWHKFTVSDKAQHELPNLPQEQE